MAWSLFLAVPVAASPFVDGIPLGPLEACAIALVWWVWAAERRLPGTRTLIVLALLKLAAGMALVPGGLAARYYANDSWTPPIERSVEFRRNDITRRDRVLAFGGERQEDLPLHFFNDMRFNFFRPSQPRRIELPYSVVWEGWIAGDDARSARTFYIDALPGMHADLSIDERPVVTFGNTASVETGSAALTGRWHFVRIRAAAPYGAGRRIEAGEVVAGARRAFDERWVFPYPAGLLRRTADAAARWVTGGVNLLVLSWLGMLAVGSVRRAWIDRRVGRLLWLVAIADAALFAFPYVRHVVIFGGGEDWLTYEHLARAIVSDPLLQQPGPAPGQGTPFYYQVLYPYFLASVHALSGDGIFGVAFVQRLLLAAAVGWVAAMTTRLFGANTGRLALGVGGLLMYAKGGRWADVLLGESLFTPLLAWWVYLLVETATPTVTRARVAFVGVAGGVVTLIRATVIAGLPLVVPMWALAVRARRARAAATLMAAFLAVLLLVTARTWVVTGTVAMLPSGGGVTWAIDNGLFRTFFAPAPDAAVVEEGSPPAEARAPVEYNRVWEQLSRRIGRRVLFVVGLFDYSTLRATGVSVPSVSWLYIAIWCAAIAGTVRLLRGAAGALTPAMALPGLMALSHFAVMLIFAPQVYGDRRILPLYPLLVPYAALGIVPLFDLARARLHGTACAVLAAMAFCAFGNGPWFRDVLPMLVVGGAALALSLGPSPRVTRQGWLYVGYAAVALVVYAAGRYYGGFEIDPSSAFLFPLAVFAVARLSRVPTADRAVVAAAIAGAVIAVALVRPAMPTVGGDLFGRLSDVGQDARGLVRGNPGALEELEEDAAQLWSDVSAPVSEALGGVVAIAGPVAALLLIGIWIRAVAISGAAARRHSGVAGLCCAALLLMGALAVLGVAPSAWGATSYSIAALALLAGLAESRAAGPAPG